MPIPSSPERLRPTGTLPAPRSDGEPLDDRVGRRSFRTGVGRVLAAVAGLVAVVALAAATIVTVTGDGDAGNQDTRVSGPDTGQDDDPIMSSVVDYVHQASGDTVTDQQARCIADKIVEVMSRERLEAAEIAKVDDPLTAITPEEVPTFTTAGLDCLPDDALIAYLAGTWDPGWFDGIPAAGARCVYEGFLARWFRRLTVTLYGRLMSPGDSPPAVELANATFSEPVDDVITECRQRFTARESERQ